MFTRTATQITHFGQNRAPPPTSREAVAFSAAREDNTATGELFSVSNSSDRLQPTLTRRATALSTYLRRRRRDLANLDLLLRSLLSSFPHSCFSSWRFRLATDFKTDTFPPSLTFLEL